MPLEAGQQRPIVVEVGQEVAGVVSDGRCPVGGVWRAGQAVEFPQVYPEAGRVEADVAAAGGETAVPQGAAQLVEGLRELATAEGLIVRPF